MKITQVKPFLLRDVAISVVVFLGVIALFVIIIGNIATNYNRNDIINAQFSSSFDKLNQVTGAGSGIDTVRSSVTGASGLQLLGNFDVAFNSMFTFFNLIWTGVDLYSNMGANLASNLTGGFISPSIIIIISIVLISCLIVYVTAVIISSVTRGRV